MKTYERRIAFLISDQHFHAHGGIGSFAKSFTEMTEGINWKVDMILDKKPRHDNFVEIIERAGANIIYPKQTISYGHHTNFFKNGDTLNSDKISNFRNAIIEALQMLKDAQVDLVTIGQYLAPSPNHLPVDRFPEPSQYDDWSREIEEMGFLGWACGPLVRSSYKAGELLAKASARLRTDKE